MLCGRHIEQALKAAGVAEFIPITVPEEITSQGMTFGVESTAFFDKFVRSGRCVVLSLCRAVCRWLDYRSA